MCILAQEKTWGERLYILAMILEEFYNAAL